MADFYRHELTDAVGNAWRIDIYEGTNAVRGVTATAIKDDVIGKIEGFTWEYDKYPLGLHTPITATIEMTADAMPSELVTWLLNPQQTSTPFELNPIGASGYTDGGNPNYRTFFQFQCQPVGQTGFKTVWYAVVAQESLRPVGGIFKVPLADAFAYALQQIPIMDVETLDSVYYRSNLSQRVSRSIVYDYYYNASGWRKVAHPSQRSTSSPALYWGVTWQSLFVLWNVYIDQMFKHIVRLPDTATRTDVHDVLLQHVRECYTQKTTTGAGANTQINVTDVYAVPFIMDDAGSGAAVLDSLHRTVERNYKTIYDLLVDLIKSAYVQAAIRYYTDPTFGDMVNIWYQRPLSDGYLAATVDITELAHEDLEPGFSARMVGTTRASNEFAIEDDYDKVEQNTRAGRNKEEYSMPVTLVSIPTIPTESYIQDATNNQEYDWSYVRYFGMWYLDDPASTGTDHLIRCHSYASYRNDGETAPTPPASMGYTLSIAQGKAAAIADQQESGQPQRMALILADTFGVPDTAEIACSLNITDVTSGYTMLPFVPACMAFGVDLADVYTWAAPITAPVVWYPTKCTYDLKAGVVEVESWGRP